VRWRRELAKARAAGQPDPAPPELAPISINLDLTTACNYRCDHCIDWDILNTRHRHDDAELRESLREMSARGLRSVILIGGGEPTLHPGFEELVRHAKQLSLKVAVVSNGSRGDRLLAVADAFAPGDWVRLSLDAGSDERFRAMHRPVSRSLTLDEICAWVPKIKAKNASLRVGYSYIIVWRGASRDGVALHENIDEIVLATERARRFGFDFIALKPVLERAPGGAEVMDPSAAQDELERVVARIRAEVEAARALADERFSVHVSTNLRVLESGNFRELTRQPRTCHMQALRQVLTPLGLYNCPAHRGVERARISGRDAFADAGRARRTQAELALLLDRFDASHECREVTCLYNGVNWWLEKMIEDPREDVELTAGEERLDHFL
jgi:wyosine [tRNA(Phe)-imidazoG37] synthetase (radical SAM superfamily)